MKILESIIICLILILHSLFIVDSTALYLTSLCLFSLLEQPLSKGLLQRLLLNLCAHSVTRGTLVHLLLDMIKPESDGMVGSLATVNSQRLYGCPLNVVYGRSQSIDGRHPSYFDFQFLLEIFLLIAFSTGLPPLVLRRVLEALTYLATNHSAVAKILFYFDPSPACEFSMRRPSESGSSKGKEKVQEDDSVSDPHKDPQEDFPFVLFLKLLNRPLFLRSSVHLEQVSLA